MRQQRNGGPREQEVVAVGTIPRAAMPAVEPPACGERANDVFVGAPGEDLRNLLDFRTGAVCNPLRDFDVCPGWPYPKQRHRSPCRSRIKSAPPTPSQG